MKKGKNPPPMRRRIKTPQPLKIPNRDTRRGGTSNKADKVLGGNIGNEQGCADEEPSYVAASKKVLFRGSFAPGEIHANSENQCEIESDDDNIRGCQRPVTRLDQRCVEHPPLLFGPSGSTMPSEAAQNCDGEVYN